MSGLLLHAWFNSSNTPVGSSLTFSLYDPFFFPQPFLFCFLSFVFLLFVLQWFFPQLYLSISLSSLVSSHSFSSIPLRSFDTKLWVGSGFEKGCYRYRAMAAPKPEEISHPPMDQLQGLEYCIDSNPSWGMSFFGFFFYFDSGKCDGWFIFWMESHFLSGCEKQGRL